MKSRIFILTVALLLVGIVAIGAMPTGAASGDGAPSSSMLVQPLTAEQQASIDSGQTQQQTVRTRPSTYTYAPGTPRQHCIAQIEPLQPGQEISEVLDVKCFNNFSDALAAATGGRVQVPQDFRPDDLTQEILDSATSKVVDAPMVDTVVGVDYWDVNFQGSTYTWWTTYTPGCSDGSSYGADLPSSWNNQISSGRGYAGCNNMKHYENTGYGGSLIICGQNWTSCANMGIMNDQTSSVNLRP